MSVTVQTSAKSLLSLGVSLGDIAVFLNLGRKFGNWLRVGRNDEELLESIHEIPTSILKRKGLVNSARMKSRWSGLSFIYEGRRNGTSPNRISRDEQDLSDFSWLMVSISAGLGFCTTAQMLRSLLIEVLVDILRGDEQGDADIRNNALVQSLRVQLPINLESWTSMVSARGLNKGMAEGFKACRRRLLGEGDSGQNEAFPQLNRAELDETKRFLKWLLARPESCVFQTVSMMVFFLADSLQRIGLHINAGGQQKYESEPVVTYINQSADGKTSSVWFHGTEDPLGRRPTLHRQASQVAYLSCKPEAMIETIAVARDVRLGMDMLWAEGVKAAAKIKLLASAKYPFTPESDVQYEINEHDAPMIKFDNQITLLANHGFPIVTQSIMVALELLFRNLPETRREWLVAHTELQHLSMGHADPNICKEDNEAMLKYSALVFGFYYGLFRPWISFEHASADSYFRGIWDDTSYLFLSMCTQFSYKMAREGSVSRTHVLYLLSSMYNGRQKLYSSATSKAGLLGILGTVSILCMSLVHTYDDPQEISRFVLVDLPVIDLIPEMDGELYSGNDYGGVGFYLSMEEPSPNLKPRHPLQSWKVNAKMEMIFGEGNTGVLMAAQCGPRLVGWFNPLAADVVFLSSAYQAPRGLPTDPEAVTGYEVLDEHWEHCQVQRPCNFDEIPHDQTILVQSRNCAALRYAATGFYTSAGEEVAISTNDITTAADRLEGPGVVIA